MFKLFNLIIFLFIFALNNCAMAQTTLITGEVKLDWPLMNQNKREETINFYRNILFKDVKTIIDKEEFKQLRKDPDVLDNRYFLKNKIRNLSDRSIAGFYFLDVIPFAYGIKYKSDKYHIYYYDMLGHIVYFDILDKPYDEFPHKSYQYSKDGKLQAVYYYLSEYDQYAYKANGKFAGRWYYDKLYDKKAKIIMTRKLPEEECNSDSNND
jgi:hypothetical protein